MEIQPELLQKGLGFGVILIFKLCFSNRDQVAWWSNDATVQINHCGKTLKRSNMKCCGYFL